MTYFLAAVVAVSLSGAPVQSSVVRKVGDRDVRVEAPARVGARSSARRIELDGQTIFGGPRGEVRGAAWTDEGWPLIMRSAPAQAKTETLDWRIKVFVITRVDLLNKGDHLRPRRAYIDRAEVDQLYQALARASVAIEALSGGARRATFDVEIDGSECFEDAEPGSTPFDEAWLRDYVDPKVNGHDFQVDDKVFRGPWDSVWVVHAGLVDRTPAITVRHMPVKAFPFFSLSFDRRPALLAEAFASAWEHDAATLVREAGYPLPALQWRPTEFSLEPMLPASIVQTTTARNPPTAAQWIERNALSGTLAGIDARLAIDSPLERVGPIQLDQLDAVVGAKVQATPTRGAVRFSIVGAATPLIRPDNALDSLLEFGSEASALVRSGANAIWFVDARYLQWIQPSVASTCKLHGHKMVDGRLVYVLSMPSPAFDVDEWTLFGLPKSERISAPEHSLASNDFFDGSLTKASTFGSFKIEDAKDPARRAVSVRQGGSSARIGGVSIYDGFTDQTYIDARQFPVFRFWLKSSHAEPLMVRFETDSPGWSGASVRIFGRWPAPEDGGQTVGAEVDVPTDGEWHQLTVDLRGLASAAPSMRVRRITFESDPLAKIWGPDSGAAANFSIGASECLATTSPVPTYGLLAQSESSAESPSKDARARWAAQAGTDQTDALIALLKDRSGLVRLNALASLKAARGTKVEAAVAESLNTLDPRIAQYAIDVLEAQATEYAWNTILRYFNGPPADGHRYFAASALARRKASNQAGVLTASYASPSWRTRREGAKALASLKSEDADTLLMVFLQEASPSVRFEVARVANTALEKVCRRVLFASVNDPSEAVRGASLVALLRSPLPAFREEGLKGVRDESPFVKIATLRAIESEPKEDVRQALQIAVADPEPEVQAAAVLAWAKFPGEVKREELGTVIESKDPRVVPAVAILKRAKPGLFGP